MSFALLFLEFSAPCLRRGCFFARSKIGNQKSKIRHRDSLLARGKRDEPARRHEVVTKIATKVLVPGRSPAYRRVRAFAPLLSGVMGDDIWFHNAVAGIVLCGQCVRVGRNVGPDISHLRVLAVDHSLVIVDERVALPMRGAPQYRLQAVCCRCRT
jgi:hypothetical protein